MSSFGGDVGPEVFEITRGSCLILKNETFGKNSGLPARKRSEKDAQNLTKIFRGLKFDVTVKEDKPKKELETALSGLNGSTADAVSVFVLTHEVDGYLCGRDYGPGLDPEQNLSYEELIKLLNNVNSKTLRHKPKMLFILTTIIKHRESLSADSASLEKKIDLIRKLKLPETSEVLVYFFAEELYSDDTGLQEESPFVTHLRSVLGKHSKQTNLLSILEAVERELQNTRVESNNGQGLRLYTSIELLGWSQKVVFGSFDQEIQRQPIIDGNYEMKSKPRGPCLIINNMFSGNDRRNGSDKDRDKLKETFRRLNFSVSVNKEDWTKEQMLEAVRRIATKEDESRRSDAAVVVVMSHGVEDGVLGKDKQILTYEELVKAFDDNCVHLRKKPKMFFVQACKGKKYSEMVADGLLVSDFRPIRRLENITDVLLSYSAQPSYYAIRHPVEGSPYVKFLAEALNKHSRHTELLDILILVERQLRDTNVTTVCNKSLCLSSSVELLGWSKKVFFFEDHDQGTERYPSNTAPTESACPESQMVGLPASGSGRTSEMEGTALWVLGGLEEPEELVGTQEGQQEWIPRRNTPFRNYQQMISNSSRYVCDQDEVFEWDKERNRLLPLTKLVPKRLLYCHAYLDNKIYVMGGQVDREKRDDCLVYDLATKKWSQLGKEMERLTTGRTAVVLNGKIYVTSGKRDIPLNKLDVFDPICKTWSKNKAMKFFRCGQAMATCGKYIWVFGGSDGVKCLSEVERYSPVSGDWEVMPSMQSARTNLSVAFFRNQFYATGGKPSNEGWNLSADVEIYDLSRNEWTRGPSLKSPRAGHCTVVL